MSDIGVGDLVVCVDDTCSPFNLGTIYTIRGVQTGNNGVYVLIEGHFDSTAERDGWEGGWYIRRFRKCRPTNIEIFRQIAAKPKERVEA